MKPTNPMKIYLLGYIPRKLNSVVINKFITAQVELEKSEYKVINPLISFVTPQLSREQAYQKNLKELLNCDAVYLLFDSTNNMSHNEELKIAFKTDKLLIHQSVVITDAGVDSIEIEMKKLKEKLRKHSKHYTE